MFSTLEHARIRNEEVVSASRVYFSEYTSRYNSPGEAANLNLRHILDVVSEHCHIKNFTTATVAYRVGFLVTSFSLFQLLSCSMNRYKKEGWKHTQSAYLEKLQASQFGFETFLWLNYLILRIQPFFFQPHSLPKTFICQQYVFVFVNNKSIAGIIMMLVITTIFFIFEEKN